MSELCCFIFSYNNDDVDDDADDFVDSEYTESL